jgi:hypothetical protein
MAAWEGETTGGKAGTATRPLGPATVWPLDARKLYEKKDSNDLDAHWLYEPMRFSVLWGNF